MLGKIINIWINKSYWFNNWSFIEYQIWKRKIMWSERDTIAENFCLQHWIKSEYEMGKLENKKFEIIDEEHIGDWTINYLIKLINKKINPDWKTFWLCDYWF